jgi:citrate/tricarballylate utilization protein
MPSADAAARTIPLALVAEGQRIMSICNACRYCEGFCAVFPAMERRLVFLERDLAFLANLCHDCRECYHACQYAPPHEFDVNVPRVLAGLRRETYRKYAWPGALSMLFTRSGLSFALAAAAFPVALWGILGLALGPDALFTAHADADGAFYQIVPHTAMVALFGGAGLAVVTLLVVGLARFWRDMGEPSVPWRDPRAIRRATTHALTLRYLDGGGEGCGYPADVPSQARRAFHHFTFYGFLSCFAATSVAAFYHNVLGWKAPYPFVSVPVILGTLGGVGLIVGPLGLLGLKGLRLAAPNDRKHDAMDVAFLGLLVLTSISGFLLLALRESPAMGTLLALHLGIVLGLFLTMPYGKFVHGIYRLGALVRNELEAGRAVDGQYPRF